MTTSRFDNIPQAELLARHAEILKEKTGLEEAIEARFRADCPVKVGKVYRIAPLPPDKRPWYGENMGNRLIYVCGLVCGYDGLYRSWQFSAHGPLKRPKVSPIRNGHFGGTYTSDHSQVPISRIDLESEQDPPEESR